MNAIHFVNVVHEFVPHARRREDKTEALLDGAMRLVVSEGLEALTLQRVAREHGLTTTAIYRYFASKDALLSALQRQAVVTMHEHFRAVLGALRESLAERRLAPEVAALAPIFLCARTYVELPTTHPETFRLVSLMLGDTRLILAEDEALRSVPVVLGFLADVQTLFVEAAEVSALAREHEKTPQHRTLVLWSTIHGLTQLGKLRRLAPGAPEPIALADAAVAALLRGFGAEPTHVTRALRLLTPLTPHSKSGAP